MDQDDSMLSTPSSTANDDTYDEETLFPSEGTATTSQTIPAQTPQNDHLNAAAPGELSPPRSTTQSQSQTNGFLSAPLAVDSNDISEDDEAIDMKGEGAGDAVVGPRGAAVGGEKNKPGAGWKNKKAQEDMQRSWDFIVDRDFDARQFGDVLAGKGKREGV